MRFHIFSFRFCSNLLLGLAFVALLHGCRFPASNTAADDIAQAQQISVQQASVQQTSAVLRTEVGNSSTERDAIAQPSANSLETLSPATQNLFNPPRGDARLVVISDLNSAYGSTDYDPEIDQAINLLPLWQPDLVLCSGDMIAGQKLTLTDAQLQAMWAAFDTHVAAPLRQANLPYGFTIGNHDASGAQRPPGNFIFERERQVARDYWNNPDHDPGVEFIDRDDFPFYYSFKQNDIFFLVWDGSSFKIPPDKLDWVERSLESPEAQSAKMKVLIGHLPLYAVATGRDKPGEVMANADALREMLEQHQVHTYISGHQHAYYPGHKGELQLLHMGILGSGPRAYVGSSEPTPKSLTVIDVNFDDSELTTYTTYDMETLDVIENEQLPRFLTGHNGMVRRRDVAALTPEEQTICESRLDRDRCRS